MNIDQTYAAACLNLITEGIVIIDHDGCVNACNTAIEQMFGWPEADLLGKPLSQFILSKDYPQILEQLEAVKVSGISQTFRLNGVTASQEQFLATCSIVGPQSEDSNGFIVTFKDISEQQLLERHQEELENRLRRESLMRHLAEVINESLDLHEILNTTANAVGEFFEADYVIISRFFFNPDTQLFEDIVITQYCANTEIGSITQKDLDLDVELAVALYSGWTQEALKAHITKSQVKELTNLTWEERVQFERIAGDLKEDLNNKLEIYAKRVAHFETLVEKYKLNTFLDASIQYKSLVYGHIMICDSNASRTWTEDEHVLVQFVADQLGGALAQAELYSREQQARQEAEIANRRKSEFLGMMSHELRTPLNAIIGYSEMTLKGLAGALSDRQAKYLNHVFSSGKHLLNIVNDLLDVSQIETGQLALHPHSFELESLLEEIRFMMQALADKRQIKLVFDIEPGLKQMNADPNRFKQILINLLSNAVKFNREQGSVYFKLYKSPDDQWLIGEVEDTGIGIPQAMQKDLFTKFYQVDSRLARTHEGTGLGLALAKEIVTGHGGEIDVQSVEGQGSTFTFTLPLQVSLVGTL